METDEVQELQVKKDLATLTRSLTPIISILRLCSPRPGVSVRVCRAIEPLENGTVSERLKRVQMPE